MAAVVAVSYLIILKKPILRIIPVNDISVEAVPIQSNVRASFHENSSYAENQVIRFATMGNPSFPLDTGISRNSSLL